MRILAVDTSTTSFSVAVLAGDRLLAEVTADTGETHSRHLLPAIDTVLNLAETMLSDVDGFAVTTGPGSFTGLRIGVSTIKGLAVAVAKPVAAVSSLHALAVQAAERSHLICAMIDARKKEVYSAFYRFSERRIVQTSPPRVSKVEAILDEISEPCIMVGNGALLYKDRIECKAGAYALFAENTRHEIRARTVGSIAMRRLAAGENDDVAELRPQYIRQSDAKIRQTGAKISGAKKNIFMPNPT